MSIPSKELFKDKYKSLEKIEGVVDNACPTIQVVAPSNLPGDYIFEVDLDGQRYAVIVVCYISKPSVCTLCWLCNSILTKPCICLLFSPPVAFLKDSPSRPNFTMPSIMGVMEPGKMGSADVSLMVFVILICVLHVGAHLWLLLK